MSGYRASLSNGKPDIVNREAWLAAMVDQLRPLFIEQGAEIPRNVRVAVAFPSTGRKGKRIGECWSSEASGDGTFEIMIRPDIDDPIRIADILAHELVHAAVGLDAGHGKTFKQLATAIGLTGKMTATVASDALKEHLAKLVEYVGPLPHARLNIGGKTTSPKKQTARMIKCECTECGYIARTTKSWIETVGPPHCPEHGAMEVK